MDFFYLFQLQNNFFKMAPDTTSTPTGVLFEDDQLDNESTKFAETNKAEVKNTYKFQLVWRNVILFALLHSGALYGVYLIFTSAKIATTVFGK